MDKNFIIYFVIILICIILFSVYFYNKDTKSKHESFTPWDFDNNQENILKEFKNIIIIISSIYSIYSNR